MLDGIRLKNIRSLVDTGILDLKPITLLLGQNSSGKSTFLRSLPLLRQSSRTRSNAPILWYGDFVDFGSFSEVRSSFSPDGPIGFSFRFSNLQVMNRHRLNRNSASRVIREIEVGIELHEVDSYTRLKSLYVEMFGDRIEISCGSKGIVSEIKINGNIISKSSSIGHLYLSFNDIIPQLMVARDKDKSTLISPYVYSMDLAENEIFSMLREMFDARVANKTIQGLMRKLQYASENDFYSLLDSVNLDIVNWQKVKADLKFLPWPKSMERLRNLYSISMLPEVLYWLSQALSNSCNDLAYMGPSRATGERYYRHQELAIDQIDPQGQNLAMFLHSLSPLRQSEFSTWLEDAIGYSLRVGKSGGHVQIELCERGAGAYHNLADMGYGFSQILPVLAQVWGRQTRRVNGGSPFIAIEQPELHLHPAYQAKIADVMTNVINNVGEKAGSSRKTVFLVETHSENLVNRLGELIYEGKLSPNSVAIYLFNRESSTDRTEIHRSNFDENGDLQHWPLGFFSMRSAK